MHPPNSLAMNINDSMGSGLALPFLRRHEKRSSPPLAKQITHPVRGHIVAFLGELIGTFLFLFFSFAGLVNSSTTNSNDVVTPALYTSIAFGFALLVNAWTFFRVSGALFNPAVTWGMCLIGALGWFRGALLFVAQLLGAILAAAFVKALFPGNVDVRTTIGGGASVAQAFFIETIMTLQLVLVIFLLAAEKHKATFLAPVGIGLALFSGMLASIRYTGASMNPARSFGPAITLSGFHGYHWIYWVAPWLGSTIAVLIYKLMKALEYETATPNPGQEDTGEEKANKSDRSSVPNNTNPPQHTFPSRGQAHIGQGLARHPQLQEQHGFTHTIGRRPVGGATYSSGPHVENGVHR